MVADSSFFGEVVPDKDLLDALAQRVRSGSIQPAHILSAMVCPECVKPALSRPRSPLWRGVRGHWLRDNPVCAACGGKDALEVHHKKPYHLSPELELDPGNFMTLCEKPSRNCHLTWGHCYDWLDYNPEVEQAVAWWKQVLKGVSHAGRPK